MGRHAWQVIGIAMLTAVVAIAAIAGGTIFIKTERHRALLHWQTQLGIIVDGRATVVDTWVAEQVGALRRLADNAAVQIYVMGIARGLGTDAELAQQGYMRNLLELTAQSQGFVDRVAVAAIPANVRRASNAGLIVLSADRRILVQSESAPPLAGALAEFARSIGPSVRSAVAMYLGEGNVPVVAFAVPVFSVQGGTAPDAHIGFIVGAKEAANELYPLLVQPGDPSTTGEALLIARDNGVLRYLSPRRDGARPLTRQLSMTTPDLDVAYAWNEPGGFAEKVDYANRRVLATGRRLDNAPWLVAYTVERDEAIGSVDRRERMLATTLGIAALLVLASIALAWSLGASRKTRALAEAYRSANAEIEKGRRFLALLRDEDPSPTFTLLRDGTIGFANAAFGALAGMSAKDASGKTLDQVFGPGMAKRFAPAVQEAVARSGRVDRVCSVEIGGKERFFDAKHIFLERQDEDGDAVLVIENDVTDVVEEREHRRRIQDKVIGAVVSMIDQLDPTARGHSDRVARLSEWIAETMDLDVGQIEAVRQAAMVANIGKALIPQELLKKADALTEDERAIVRNGLGRAHELLATMEFFPPALEVVRASRENWDGSGNPAGLSADAIPQGARILRVANAFVALTSERLYRASKTIEQAFEILLAESGTKYDRRVVIALMHFFDNAAGRAKWIDLTAAQAP